MEEWQKNTVDDGDDDDDDDDDDGDDDDAGSFAILAWQHRHGAASVAALKAGGHFRH